MKTIYIIDILNSITAYQLVRRFKFQKLEYLIYTDNQREKRGNHFYINNYAAIKNPDNMWIEPSQQEWNEFKKIIKNVAEESSFGVVTNIQDLHVDDRESFIVISNRSFKVIPFYHHLISSNFNDYRLQTNSDLNSSAENHKHNSLQYQFEVGSIDSPEIDYVKEYYNLKKLTIEQKKKLDQIKNIVNNNLDS